MSTSMNPTVLLVPGAWHGAWWFEGTVDELAARGRRAEAVTLAGIGERAPELDGTVTLSSHVTELVDHVRGLDGPVVLVGHSYGSMVVAGVADAVPDRVVGLLSVDGFAPQDGDSCWALTSEELRQWNVDGSARTGIAVDPLPWLDERTTPHPLATLMQRIVLTGAHETVPVKHHALAVDETWLPHSPFRAVADRLRTDPTWTRHEIPTTHDVLRDGPETLVTLVESVLADVTARGGRSSVGAAGQDARV